MTPAIPHVPPAPEGAPASSPADVWASAEPYERYIGRWSRPVGEAFVDWLGVAPDAAWAEVGCGTGALTGTILARARPRTVRAIDRSAAYAGHARRHVPDARALLAVADARQLPWPDASADAVVSGLVLNFVPAPERAAAEMARVALPGAVVAAYLWDYGGGMRLIHRFWDAAIALDPAAAALDEAARFPLCREPALGALWRDAGLRDVATRAIDVPTVFRDFDDYWTPFLGGQGPAPAYLASLDPAARDRLRDRVRASLPVAPDGAIALTARAWAVRGVR